MCMALVISVGRIIKKIFFNQLHDLEIEVSKKGWTEAACLCVSVFINRANNDILERATYHSSSPIHPIHRLTDGCCS